jgi:hypothetical protein
MEEQNRETEKRLKLSILILIFLILTMIGTILYLQYKLTTFTQSCRTFYNTQIQAKCPGLYNEWGSQRQISIGNNTIISNPLTQLPHMAYNKPT